MPVHETVYRRIEGAHPVASRFAFLPVAAYALKGHRNGWLFKAAKFAAFIPPVFATIALYFTSRVQIGGPSGEVDVVAARAAIADPAFTFFIAQLSVMTFFAAMAGGPVVAEDLRRHALELYFSKPVGAFDYALGKWLGVFQALCFAMVVPLLLAGAALIGFAPGGFAAYGTLILRACIAGVLAAAICALVVLGVSAVGRSGRYAVVLWFVVSLFTHLAAFILVQTTRNDAFGVVSFRTGIGVLTSRIMDVPGELPRFASDPPTAAMCGAMLGGWCLLSVLVLRMRLRGGRS